MCIKHAVGVAASSFYLNVYECMKVFYSVYDTYVASDFALIVVLCNV